MCDVWDTTEDAVQNDFAHNEKFITIHVVEGNGRRVYYPGE